VADASNIDSAAPLCTFDERWQESTAIISCEGDIDMTTSPELERRIAAARERSPSAIIVDLSRVQFLSSSGIGLLAAADERCRPDIRFAVVAEGRATQRPMELVGITATVTVRSTLQAALDAIAT
jgi:anti-anti-sigma factor